jgi:hypothetical protein
MSIKGKGVLLAVGVLGSILGAGPVLAQSGHGGGGGGGHMSGGGGHAMGGSHGGSVGHAAGGAHFVGGAHYGGGGVHYASGVGAHGYAGGYHGTGYAGHGAYGYPGHYYGHGYSTGAYWRGGYWHGGYWPRAYYGAGFAWFLPILPLAYATYWYGGVPYYYANDVYYTWNPSYSGYTATDPPPVAQTGASDDGSGGYDAGAAVAPSDSGAPNPGPSAPPPGATSQMFMYPKNGQSAEQQATDKAECQQWAASQAGQVAQNAPDYQRAMAACVEGRGYTAR